MVSCGSEFDSIKNIENAKDLGEFNESIEKSLSGKVSMSDKFKARADFEVVLNNK